MNGIGHEAQKQQARGTRTRHAYLRELPDHQQVGQQVLRQAEVPVQRRWRPPQVGGGLLLTLPLPQRLRCGRCARLTRRLLLLTPPRRLICPLLVCCLQGDHQPHGHEVCGCDVAPFLRHVFAGPYLGAGVQQLPFRRLLLCGASTVVAAKGAAKADLQSRSLQVVTLLSAHGTYWTCSARCSCLAACVSELLPVACSPQRRLHCPNALSAACECGHSLQ
jgi:hypothetical protein